MRINSDLEMIAYLTECTLATVDQLALKKSRPKWEYERQKTIAQKGIDFLKGKTVDCHNLRVCQLLKEEISVGEYVKKFEIYKKSLPKKEESK